MGEGRGGHAFVARRPYFALVLLYVDTVDPASCGAKNALPPTQRAPDLARRVGSRWSSSRSEQWRACTVHREYSELGALAVVKEESWRNRRFQFEGLVGACLE